MLEGREVAKVLKAHASSSTAGVAAEETPRVAVAWILVGRRVACGGEEQIRLTTRRS